ncbi:hypothetical protein J7E93_18005 [Streptomyces sp. ISL-36]|uniref:hypothetical protein n=1 Tax=Streptomyces sp. ISL-36 TaxID=2819182 RepID=UPI001BE704D3|nr:hypothetical protein [Streptomyces sp. ISL-36]MBT2441967.1 hypothetical protein [Streptomyces sp. ISL-36]
MVRRLQDNAPVSAAALRPAAAAEDIAAAEHAGSVPFPAELRTWLTINNGVRTADSTLDRAPYTTTDASFRAADTPCPRP